MSNQNAETPTVFVKEIQRVLKVKFRYDMAAEPETAKAPKFFTKEWDSLQHIWPLRSWLWLNPNFEILSDWIQHVSEQYDRGCKMVTIWPLSSDKNQLPAWTKAQVNIIHGRIWPCVRGCMLCKWDRTDYFKQICGWNWDGKILERVW